MKTRLFYVRTHHRCAIFQGETEMGVRDAVKRDIGVYDGMHATIRPATRTDIACVDAMGGYIPTRRIR